MLGYHTQIPVKGLRRVHEKGGGARTGQARRDLLPYMTGFPDPSDDDPGLAVQYGPYRRFKFVVHPTQQFLQRVDLDFQGLDGFFFDHDFAAFLDF